MSCRVNFYSLSGGGSIGTLPGVVPAAWGGPWRAWRAVRVVPKTRNYTYTRVKVYLEVYSKYIQAPVGKCGVSNAKVTVFTSIFIRMHVKYT